MMRVPGSNGNLLGAKAQGADVRFVYSPLDALRVAADNPERQVVFFAVGFETTAPSTAATLLRARQDRVMNFSVFSNHVTIVPPIKAILESPDLRLDGFLGPGHVSTVVGQRPYRFVPEVYGKPLVTAGFEPLDILQAIVMLLTQISEGRCCVENQYTRCVSEAGNPRALAILNEVFELRPHFEWRGLGFISQSALKLRPEFAEWDAELRFEVPGVRVADPKACQCGEVLKGVIKPWECKVFGTACTPETPIGTCMVSSEGACAAYYNFGRLHREVASPWAPPARSQPGRALLPARSRPAPGSVAGPGAERGDGRLADADPAVVGRHRLVHEDAEPLRDERVLDDVAEADVLEHAPAQRHGVEAVPRARRAASAAVARPRPSWKPAAITARSVPRSSSSSTVATRGAGSSTSRPVGAGGLRSTVDRVSRAPRIWERTLASISSSMAAWPS